jgi:methyl-accepting chemotaxis protein
VQASDEKACSYSRRSGGRLRINVVQLLVVANAIVLVATAGVGWWMTHAYDSLFIAAQTEHAQRLADTAIGEELWRGHFLAVSVVAQQIAQDEALKRATLAADSAALAKQLPDEFHRGAISSGEITALGITIYDPSMKFIAETWVQTKESVPTSVTDAVAARQGADRVRLAQFTWTHDGSPRMTVVTPIGGIRFAGYLALHVDPIPALKDIDRRLDM